MKLKIERFISQLYDEEKSKNTIEKYARDIKEFYGWNSNRCSITKPNLLKYKEHLMHSNIKASTINSKIAAINSYLSHAGFPSLKLKPIKCQKLMFCISERDLSVTEFNKLLSSASLKLRLIMKLIAGTGIRVSELKHITVESLHFRKATIYNKSKIRNIIIPRKICLMLLKYCKAEKITTGPIFLTCRNRPIDRKQIWQMMKCLSIKANVVSTKVFPHSLRHLFAREFYNQTKDIVKLASILGHSSIETTKIYARESEQECRECIEKLGFL